MSLEPDTVNPRHAAMVEDDQHPGWDAVPEATAARRIGQLLAKYLGTSYLTADFFAAVGGKAVANRDALRRIFDEVDADPRRLRESGVQLRQQQVARFGDEDGILERLAEVNAERDLLHGWLTQMRSPYAPPPKLLDRDEVNADDDARREQVERSIEDAPAVRLEAS